MSLLRRLWQMVTRRKPRRAAKPTKVTKVTLDAHERLVDAIDQLHEEMKKWRH